MESKISVRRVGGHRHRLRITVMRGAVSTEATLTEAEAIELHRKLGVVLARSQRKAEVPPVGQGGTR